ncbi:response regulator [Paenibacillus koleovorans]|uniref:response regulator n=1 Tax=Paenibacillus koleovorans TaxID=121608 RepID=UPI000FD99D95|nr:response regulator [Paenibacillus koleovorans]
MFHLLIVEDIQYVCAGIKSDVEGFGLPFSTIRTAANGVEAVAILESHHIDIVITDIKMPKMDGLQLTEYLHHRFAAVRVVILSAYEDFGYAQRAIRFGVKGYLLKPLKSEALRDILAALIKERQLAIEEEQRGGSDSSAVRQDQLLKYAIERNPERTGSRPDPLDGAEHAEPLNGYMRAVICRADAHGGDRPGFSLNEFILNAAKRYWSPHQVPVVWHMDYVVIGLNGEACIYIHQIEPLLRSFVQFVTDQGNQFGFGLKLMLSVGNLCSHIKQFYASHNQAVYALSYRFFNRTSQIVFFQELNYKSYAELDEPAINQLVDRVVDGVLGGEKQRMLTYVHELFRAIERKGTFSTADIHTKCLEMLFHIDIRLRQLERPPEALNKSVILNEIRQISDFQELEMWFERTLLAVMEQRTGHPMTAMPDFVKKAIAYAIERYRDKISLEEVAGKLHMHPAYFSAQFKKATGTGFIDYVNMVRIEKSRELLAMPDYRVKEIAEQVGFNDYTYFCRVFKKLEGTSPLQYRADHL